MFFYKTDKALFRDGNSAYYFMKLKDLCSVFNGIKIWRLNRPVDEVRVYTISKYYIEEAVCVVPGQISGWLNEKNEVEIYDGFHRYSACVNNKMDDMYMYIKVMETDNLHDVISDFKNLNQSVSVPTLYYEQNSEKKKQVCEAIAKRLCDRYPECRSASRNPQPQNFNRDGFIELLSLLSVDFYLENLEVKLWNELVGLNLEAQHYVKTHKIKTPKKCDYYRFWLFYLQREYIKKKLESAAV